jgi:anthranilate synthase component 2
MIAIIDNYDSFTYNVVQRLGEIDASIDVQVFRNDEVSVEALADKQPSHLIISPGPCTPDEAGISMQAAKHFGGKIPLLGICLGHQSIGQVTGGEIVRADQLMHGKTDEIHHNQGGLFQGIPSPMVATRYHSLVIRPESLSEDFEMVAWAEDNGSKTIMAIQHRTHPTFGLQFHPESFLTKFGVNLLGNFLNAKV